MDGVAGHPHRQLPSSVERILPRSARHRADPDLLRRTVPDCARTGVAASFNSRALVPGHGVAQTCRRASIGLILRARLAGSMQAITPTMSITAHVIPSHPANSATSSSRIATRNSRKPPRQRSDSHQHHGAGQDFEKHMARVGAKRRAQPDCTRPPRDADGQQREDAQRRQEQDERGHPSKHNGDVDPLPSPPFVQRPRVLHRQPGIDIGHNADAQRARPDCRARARSSRAERPFPPTRGETHTAVRSPSTTKVQVEVAHDAHDLVPARPGSWCPRRRTADGRRPVSQPPAQVGSRARRPGSRSPASWRDSWSAPWSSCPSRTGRSNALEVAVFAADTPDADLAPAVPRPTRTRWSHRDPTPA